MILARLRGKVAQRTSLDTLINVLDLLGSLLPLAAAVLAFFVPTPAPPPPVSGDGRREPVEGAEGGAISGPGEAAPHSERGYAVGGA